MSSSINGMKKNAFGMEFRNILTPTPLQKCPKCKSENISEIIEEGLMIEEIEKYDPNSVLCIWNRCSDCRLIISEKWKLSEIETMDQENGIKQLINISRKTLPTTTSHTTMLLQKL